MVFFWAGEVSETKAAVVKVPEGFVLNVCNATLASAPSAADGAVVSLGLETAQMDTKAWKGVVAHLGASAHQVKLDLVFGAAPQVKFYVAKGSGKVNLTGYFQPGPSADLLEVEEPTKAAAVSSATSNKKRAREEAVTWDQTPSDSEDEKPKVKTVVAPLKQQKKDKKPEQKQPQPEQKKQPQQPAPVANGAGASEGSGSAKKKHRKQKKKGNSGDKAN